MKFAYKAMKNGGHWRISHTHTHKIYVALVLKWIGATRTENLIYNLNNQQSN
jgi:hypothetical protein